MKQDRIAAVRPVRSESSEPEGEPLADTEETAGASENRETGGQDESGSNGKTNSTAKAEKQGEESLTEEGEADTIVTAQGKRVQGIAFIAEAENAGKTESMAKAEDAETSTADATDGQEEIESMAITDSTKATGQRYRAY